MNMDLEFDLEERPWERSLSALRPGGTLSAAHFLAKLSEADQEELDDAIDQLRQKDILLDTGDLVPAAIPQQTAQRLVLERELAESGSRGEELEENDPLRLSLEQWLAQSPLEPERIPALAAAAAAGDARAASALAEGFLPLLWAVAKEYAGQGALLTDLMQEGSLALWQAVMDCPDPRGFEALALRQARLAMAGAVVAQHHAWGTGAALLKAMQDYDRADRELLRDLGHNPSREEIAQYLHVDPQRLETLEKMRRDAAALEKAVPQPQEAPEQDAPVEDTAYFQQRMEIEALLSGLTPEDRQLLELRFGLTGKPPMSPAEAGRALGLTPGQVQQREARALSALRQKSN